MSKSLVKQALELFSDDEAAKVPKSKHDKKLKKTLKPKCLNYLKKNNNLN